MHVCFLTVILIATLDKIIYFSYSEFSTGYYRLRILIFGNVVHFMQLETYSSILKEILTFLPLENSLSQFSQTGFLPIITVKMKILALEIIFVKSSSRAFLRPTYKSLPAVDSNSHVTNCNIKKPHKVELIIIPSVEKNAYLLNSQIPFNS